MADCICAVLLTCAAATAISQEWPLDLPAPNVPRQRDEARGLIQLDVVVTGASGEPVVGLNARDFSLLENGQAQKILSFQAFDGVTAKTEPPVQIILVLDTIQLPEELARKERVAVESFLRKNGGKLERPTSIYWLTDLGLWTVAHPSGDGRVMARDIEHSDIRLVRPVVGSRLAGIPRSATAPDPAPESALKALGQIASSARRVPGRKLLIWIGPGTGMGSGAGNMTIADLGAGSSRPQKPFYTVCWFSALLRDARVTLYSLAVGEMEPNLQYKSHLGGVEFPQKAGYPNLDRKVLAVQSGGRVMDESFDLVKEIEDCVRGADAFYTLTFDPAPANRTDEYHEIKVEIDRPGVTARTNTGYYDQPFYSVERIPAVQRISVKELETLVETSAGASDGDLARQLNELELTERLSGSRLAGIASKMRGKKSQMALVVLADASTFLDPPADEIPRAAEPDATAQRQMLARTAEYLKNTIPKLPDLFAKQVTVRYQETPQFHEGPTNVEFEPLHVTDTLKATVHYRGGFEITDFEKKPRKRNKNDPELITYGTFGPVLEGVMHAIAEDGRMTWSHWERGAGGTIAVFRYVVPADKSLYQVLLCCTPDGDGTGVFLRYAGYHGVIAIDPTNGAILRLGWQADLKSTTPLTESAMMIDYGPVKIAGKTYICPLTSISIARLRSVDTLGEWDEKFMTWGPYATMLNDITFSGYHVFRSESRVLPQVDESSSK